MKRKRIKPKRRNNEARALEHPLFRPRVIPDKREKAKEKEAKNEQDNRDG